jgi:HlyD family secretion protein
MKAVVWRRRIFLAALVAGVIGALAWALRPTPVLVQVEPVSRGAMRVTVLEEGQTRIKDRFEISAPIPGVMCRLELEAGDRVEADKSICAIKPLRSEVLDPRARARAEAQVAAAEARLQAATEQVRAADAAADLAVAELGRIRALFAKGDVAEGTLDRAEADARAARANQRSAGFEVERARYEKEAARTALKYAGEEFPEDAAERVVVRSPVDGQVLKVYRKSEGVISAGEPLLEVGDPRALEVEVDVLSADAVRIPEGGRVIFERWGGQPLEGRVRVIEPAGFTKVSALGVEEQRVWVIADIVAPVEQWQRLGDGYRVEARFVLWEADDVLQVPESALFRHGEGWAVFVVEGDRARLREVEVGRRNGLRAEVLRGLGPEDRVVAHPPSELQAGGRVREHSPGSTSG